MDRAITLAVDLDADPTRVSGILSSTDGRRADRDVAADRARFGARAATGTSVLFRHYGFGAGYPESDLEHTAQTWALTPRPFFPATA